VLYNADKECLDLEQTLEKLVSQAIDQIDEQYSIVGSAQVRKYDRRPLKSLISVNL